MTNPRETPDLRAALAAWLRSRPNDAEAETQLVLAAREWLDEATPAPAPAVLDVERLTDQKAALLELIALMAKAIGDATFLVGTDGATTTLLVFGKGSPLGTDGLPLPPGQIVAGTGEPDGLVSALAKAMELVGTDNVELVRMPAALTATPSEATDG